MVTWPWAEWDWRECHENFVEQDSEDLRQGVETEGVQTSPEDKEAVPQTGKMEVQNVPNSLTAECVATNEEIIYI